LIIFCLGLNLIHFSIALLSQAGSLGQTQVQADFFIVTAVIMVPQIIQLLLIYTKRELAWVLSALQTVAIFFSHDSATFGFILSHIFKPLSHLGIGTVFTIFLVTSEALKTHYLFKYCTKK